MIGLRRSASDPQLSCAQPLEVFVATRPLMTKLPHVPEHLQAGLLADVGCAHYYTVIRRPCDGQLTQLDFGPVGGDIAFAPKPAKRGLWSWACRVASCTPLPPRGTQAEVREVKLNAMPDNYMFVGSTALSLADIRSFNTLQSRVLYLLHQNDCRHYVNSLVHYTTGVQGVTRKATRHIFKARTAARRNASRLAWSDRLILLSHTFTDVGSWPRLQKYSKAAIAMLAAVAGRRTLAQLAPFQIPAASANAGFGQTLLRRTPAGLAGIPASASSGSLHTAATAASSVSSSCTALANRATSIMRPLAAGQAGVAVSRGAVTAAATSKPSMFWGLCTSLRSAAASSRQAIRSAGANIGHRFGARATSLTSGRALSAGAAAVAAGATRGSGGRLAYGVNSGGGRGAPQQQHMQLSSPQTVVRMSAVKPHRAQRCSLQPIGARIM